MILVPIPTFSGARNPMVTFIEVSGRQGCQIHSTGLSDSQFLLIIGAKILNTYVFRDEESVRSIFKTL